jgi:hypothetical protein
MDSFARDLVLKYWKRVATSQKCAIPWSPVTCGAKSSHAQPNHIAYREQSAAAMRKSSEQIGARGRTVQGAVLLQALNRLQTNPSCPNKTLGGVTGIPTKLIMNSVIGRVGQRRVAGFE